MFDRKSRLAAAVAAAFLALTSTGMSLSAGPPKAKDNDRTKLQGSWKVCRVEVSDTDPKQVSTDFTIGIEDDRLTWEYANGRKDEWRFTLRGSKTPKQIDFQGQQAGVGGAVIELRRIGIYALEGDKLKICFSTVDPKESERRPMDFTAKDGQGRVLLVLERAKAGKRQ